jgi:hypothetical protein
MSSFVFGIERENLTCNPLRVSQEFQFDAPVMKRPELIDIATRSLELNQQLFFERRYSRCCSLCQPTQVIGCSHPAAIFAYMT